VLDGGAKVQGARAAMDRVRRAGEPFIFGLNPEEVGPFLTERGYELVEQASSPELAERYLHPLGRRPRVSPFSNVVLATY
jgi:O-methyltransferase involved in polyketide biosynthesis